MNPRPPIGFCAKFACFLEVTANKPGNVNLSRSFPGLTAAHFLRSAVAIAPVMQAAAGRPVGFTILEAVRATQRVVTTNTNLGIVLLLAPLAAVPREIHVKQGIADVLSGLTVQDARDAYEAIRLADPGGLGRVGEQDVADEPSVTLREAMALAADRDLIAAQYVNNFVDVFDGANIVRAIGVDLFDVGPTEWLDRCEAIVISLYLHLLGMHPDSLIRRKRGDAEALKLQRFANRMLRATIFDQPRRMAKLERWFAAAFPHRNPGTTADLVAACLFVALREGIIPLPASPPWPMPLT